MCKPHIPTVQLLAVNMSQVFLVFMFMKPLPLRQAKLLPFEVKHAQRF